MTTKKDVLDALRTTSRTFYIPIARLPGGLQEAIASAYLCMRSIDEIEDHAALDNATKARLLQRVSLLLQAQTSPETFARDEFASLFDSLGGVLPEVTIRIGEWACHAPASIAPRIWDAVAAMADRMAYWASTGWKIQTLADLDRYTFSVAGAVGLLLCDVWVWYDGANLNRTHAIHFGRGLQLVNILRNREEDLHRGVDFFPTGWTIREMHEYARRNLSLAEAYARSLPHGPFYYMIQIPLVLAKATLDALAIGKRKLSRARVLQLVRQAERDSFRPSAAQ